MDYQALIIRFEKLEAEVGQMEVKIANMDKINQIIQTLSSQTIKLNKIMALLDQLTADVAAETTVDNAVLTLLTTLAAEITAAGTDPVALKALTDQMEANAASLQAAVTANTPAATT
jgi:hypothetical protein